MRLYSESNRQESEQEEVESEERHHESVPQRLKRLNHPLDVTVLENQAPAPSCSSGNDIDDHSGQVVGPNDLVWEQHPKGGVDRAHKSVAEIRFRGSTG
jgi:hypothetical protein